MGKVEWVFEGGPFDAGGLPDEVWVSMDATTWRMTLPSDYDGLLGQYDLDIERTDPKRHVYVWRFRESGL